MWKSILVLVVSMGCAAGDCRGACRDSYSRCIDVCASGIVAGNSNPACYSECSRINGNCLDNCPRPTPRPVQPTPSPFRPTPSPVVRSTPSPVRNPPTRPPTLPTASSGATRPGANGAGAFDQSSLMSGDSAPPGVIVGCVLAGMALVGAAIAYVLLKKRRYNMSAPKEVEILTSTEDNEAGGVEVVAIGGLHDEPEPFPSGMTVVESSAKSTIHILTVIGADGTKKVTKTIT